MDGVSARSRERAREKMAWNRNQARMAAKQARSLAGSGWDLLGNDLREALVAREVMSIVIGQDAPSVLVADVEALLCMASTEAKLMKGVK